MELGRERERIRNYEHTRHIKTAIPWHVNQKWVKFCLGILKWGKFKKWVLNEVKRIPQHIFSSRGRLQPTEHPLLSSSLVYISLPLDNPTDRWKKKKKFKKTHTCMQALTHPCTHTYANIQGCSQRQCFFFIHITRSYHMLFCTELKWMKKKNKSIRFRICDNRSSRHEVMENTKWKKKCNNAQWKEI